MSFLRRQESIKHKRHSCAGRNPSITNVIPAQAGIHQAQTSFLRRQESIKHKCHSCAGRNPSNTNVIPAQAGIH
jgi:NAD/NADP transhydrogenase beta subunit